MYDIKAIIYSFFLLLLYNFLVFFNVGIVPAGNADIKLMADVSMYAME